MRGEDSQGTGGLSPQYHTYERQKCFIAYTEQAEWSDDLLSACQEVLSRPEFNLQPDYARRHFYPDVPLRQKALELIANARYGIYDLSYWQDAKCEWQMPRNVFIELGMAIALNRPTLLLRHANNRELELPECLKSVRGHILEFSGETTLKRVLEKRLPQWVSAPPDRDWWNRYCIFGGRTCEFREAHPRAKQWGQKVLHCYISDGPDVDRDDFRGVVEEVLGRFSDVTFDYLDALPVAKGRDFLLCTCCETVRSTPFAIYRITPQAPADTFVAIGMSVALEMQFEYRIPKVLLTEDVQDIPSLLSGYEVVVARSDGERKKLLREFVPTVIHKVRETVWKPRSLPFAEVVVVGGPVPEPDLRDYIVFVDIDQGTTQLVRPDLEREGYEVVEASSGREILALAAQRTPTLIVLDLQIADIDGYEVIRRMRSGTQTRHVPIIVLSAKGDIEDETRARMVGADDYLVKPLEFDELRARIETRIRFVRRYRAKPDIAAQFAMAESSSRDYIIVMQNDKDLTALLCLGLGREGYEVAGALSGREVLELAAQRTPTLIALDWWIDDIDGYEVIRRLRSDIQTSHTLIIVLSSGLSVTKALTVGADDYLIKPFDLDELRLRISNLITRSRTGLSLGAYGEDK